MLTILLTNRREHADHFWSIVPKHIPSETMFMLMLAKHEGKDQ